GCVRLVEARGPRGAVEERLSLLPAGQDVLALPPSKDWRLVTVRAAGHAIAVTVDRGPSLEFSLDDLRRTNPAVPRDLSPYGALGVWSSQGVGFFQAPTITALGPPEQ